MNNRPFGIIAVALLSLALAAPSGAQLFGKKKSPAEKRNEIENERTEILEDIFAANPDLKKKVAEAPGYGTFSALNVNLLVLSTARGKGMVVDNVNKEKVFMKLLSLGGGIGAGLKDLRALIIFNDADTLQEFIGSGWHFGAQADAVAKSDDKGGEIGESVGMAAPSEDGNIDASMSGGLGGATQADTAMEIYRITEAGISLQATIGGVKFSKDEDLN